MKKALGTSAIKPISIVVLLVCAAIFAGVSYEEYRVEQGRKAYHKYGCEQCHMSGGAPDLSKVKSKYDRKMVARFVEDPEAVYRERGQRPFNPEFFPMPKLNISRDEAEDISRFLWSSE
jgi:hypothetical protein